jgi:hypothetical protein
MEGGDGALVAPGIEGAAPAPWFRPVRCGMDENQVDATTAPHDPRAEVDAGGRDQLIRDLRAIREAALPRHGPPAPWDAWGMLALGMTLPHPDPQPPARLALTVIDGGRTD